MSPSNQIRDAAIVLNSLPEEMVTDVLARMDEDSRTQLTDSMDALGEVSGRELHQISKRFRAQTLQSADEAENAVTDALLWPRDSLGPNIETFGFLKYMDTEARRNLLEAEHPLNVAMVMTRLSPEFASAVTRELDPSFRLSVIRRLCDLDFVDDAKIMELRYELRMRAKRMLAIEHCTRRGLSVAADLLSLSDQRTRDGVIAWLSDRDNELGEELHKRVMTMADLADFTDEKIAELLKRVDTAAWAGALRSTIPSVANRILSCMAPRASSIVSAEMEAFDPLDEKAMHWSVEQVIGVAMDIRDNE